MAELGAKLGAVGGRGRQSDFAALGHTCGSLASRFAKGAFSPLVEAGAASGCGLEGSSMNLWGNAQHDLAAGWLFWG